MNTACPPACSRCAQLRGAALRIIGTGGLAAVTLQRLGADTHFSEAEVTRHYATAAACVYETYDEVARSIYEDFVSAFTVERSWRRALRLGARTLLRRMSEQPAEARLCLAEIFDGDHELLRRRERSRRRLIELFAQELGRRGGKPDLFRIQLELLIGASYQTIAAAVVENGAEELPQLQSELEARAFAFAPVTARARLTRVPSPAIAAGGAG